MSGPWYRLGDPGAPQPGDVVIAVDDYYAGMYRAGQRDPDNWIAAWAGEIMPSSSVRRFCVECVPRSYRTGYIADRVRYPTLAELAAYQLGGGTEDFQRSVERAVLAESTDP